MAIRLTNATPFQFGACEVFEVESGSTVINPQTGERVVVDDSTIAVLGYTFYMTKKGLDALRQKVNETNRKMR
jgi:hypothetical protein